MIFAALLTTVATLIVSHPTPVYCHAPPGNPWTGNIDGWTYYQPPRIYLRYCGKIVRLNSDYGQTLAHELIHVEHPNWAHPRVYRLERWYWRRVVRRVLRREEHATTE
jgi:hypothetical protein